ncbi:hypothetical protein BDI4_1170003 [Burkholderia diffusa]|nr:hypothetical protein BDI4_1170003 [Burkholderia diffusa]
MVASDSVVSGGGAVVTAGMAMPVAAGVAPVPGMMDQLADAAAGAGGVVNDWACGAGVDAMGCAGVAVSMDPPGGEKVGIADTDAVAEVGGAADAVAGAVVAKEAGAPPVAAGTPPNAAGAAATIVLVGASAPEDGAGVAAAAAGAMPGAACAAPGGVACVPVDQASGVRFAGVAEGVADAVDVAVNALPDGAPDATAGDTCVLCAGCDPVALKDAPVDAGAVAAGCNVAGPEALIAGVGADAAATPDAVTPEAPVATVGADIATGADGCAAGRTAAPVEGVWAGAVGAGVGVTVADAAAGT